MIKQLEVYIIRHGQTIDNVNGIVQGHQPGILTPIGIAQAKTVGSFLSDYKFDAVYVSDLQRTRDTFQNIFSENKHKETTKITFSNLLREIGEGDYEGRPSSELVAAFQASGLPKRKFKPSGDSAESWEDIHQRIVTFLRSLMTQNSKKAMTRVLLVSHGGWITEFFNIVNRAMSKPGEYVEEIQKQDSVGNCSISVVQIACKKHPNGKCVPPPSNDLNEDKETTELASYCQDNLDCLTYKTVKKGDVSHLNK